jgi:hypothetical protein
VNGNPEGFAQNTEHISPRTAASVALSWFALLPVEGAAEQTPPTDAAPLRG